MILLTDASLSLLTATPTQTWLCSQHKTKSTCITVLRIWECKETNQVRGRVQGIASHNQPVWFLHIGYLLGSGFTALFQGKLTQHLYKRTELIINLIKRLCNVNWQRLSVDMIQDKWNVKWHGTNEITCQATWYKGNRWKIYVKRHSTKEIEGGIMVKWPLCMRLLMTKIEINGLGHYVGEPPHIVHPLKIRSPDSRDRREFKLYNKKLS